MNERIKELASQVLDELVPETWTRLGYDKIKEIQFRTAELIIFECSKIAVFSGNPATAKAIKERFEVEELTR